jgi:hypothetical protein
VGAIERGISVWGIRSCRIVVWSVGGVEKGVDLDHAGAHVCSPFQHLRPDVGQEGVGRPTPEDHDSIRMRVCKEQGHGSARADGFIADFVSVEPKDGLAAECAASKAELGAHVGAGNFHDGAVYDDGADVGVVGGSRYQASDSLDQGHKAEYRA